MMIARATVNIFIFSLIAALSGLLFGLDVAYVNGALVFIVKEFQLSAIQSGSIAGYLLSGAALGALCAGALSHVFGRKKVLILAGFLFTVTVIATISASNFQYFLIARFITGIAVGIASYVAPLYLSEIAPPHIRGSLIALYQLMITCGIFLMFVSNFMLSSTHSWRIMLLVLMIPSSIMFVSSFFLLESPRWLLRNNQQAAAVAVLSKIRTGDVNPEIAEINSSLKTRLNFKVVVNKYFVRVLVLGVLLQCLQQFSGINAFMYYSSTIFANAGFADPAFSTVVIGFTNVMATIFAIKLVDKVGRKPILYIGLTLLVLSCFIVSYVFYLPAPLTSNMQYILLVSCLVFIMGFAVSLGPIIWMICAEIFPLQMRDVGLALTTTTNWIINAIIGRYTLTWFSTLGISATFLLFGVSCMLGIALIYYFTPETKGVSLELLSKNLYNDLKLRHLGSKN